MFQDGQLFGHLSVARNVGYALRLRAGRRRDRVRELLALVGLEGYDDRLPATLSGGERQRVALARALAVEPRLLLLDEPLSALDASLRERLAVDLREILRAAGTTALMVTHDHEEAFTVADRLAVMRGGEVVQPGPSAPCGRLPPTRRRRCSSATPACWSAYEPAPPRRGRAAGRAQRRAAPLRARRGGGRARGDGRLGPGDPGAGAARRDRRRARRARRRRVAGSHVVPGEPVRLRVDATRVATIT